MITHLLRRKLILVPLLILMSCATVPVIGSQTVKTVCGYWKETLFLPSRQDTKDTARRLNRQYSIHEAVCGPFGESK